MAIYSPAFRDALRVAVGERPSREVSFLTDGQVSHTLVNEMQRTGYVPGVEVVVILARALGVDPNALLDAAGKPRYIRYVPEEAGA